MILEYSKARTDVIAPTRANPSDAGLDVYYCPKDTSSVSGTQNSCTSADNKRPAKLPLLSHEDRVDVQG